MVKYWVRGTCRARRAHAFLRERLGASNAKVPVGCGLQRPLTNPRRNHESAGPDKAGSACFRIPTVGVSKNNLFRMLFARKVVPIFPGMAGWIFWVRVKGADKCSTLTIHLWCC